MAHVSKRQMTKSPLRLARAALAVAEKALPEYSAVHSPRKFTQPQLFAILVLRQFFKTDYRGVVALLEDMSEVRDALGLEEIPHYSTLCYAQRRLIKKGHSIRC